MVGDAVARNSTAASADGQTAPESIAAAAKPLAATSMRASSWLRSLPVAVADFKRGIPAR
jgi:hypothetical protein